MALREKWKGLVKRGLITTRVTRVANRFVPPGIAILRYHSVRDEPKHFTNSIGSIIHSTTVFKKQMELVSKEYDPVTLDDVLLFLRGKVKTPKRPVAITFDDGFADNYEIAAPIMDSFGLRGAFYITVDSIENLYPPWFIRLRHAFSTTRVQTWIERSQGEEFTIQSAEERNAAFIRACEKCGTLSGILQKESISAIEQTLDLPPYSPNKSLMMSWTQIKELHRGGHIIGSHTMTHPNLAFVISDDLDIELVKARKRIEDELGANIIHFSYPSPILQPHWNEHTIEGTRRAGYQTAVTSTTGKVLALDNPLSIKRIWVPFEMDEFEWNLACTLLGRDV